MADSKKKVVRRVKARTDDDQVSRREAAIKRVRAEEEAKQKSNSVKKTSKKREEAIARVKAEEAKNSTSIKVSPKKESARKSAARQKVASEQREPLAITKPFIKFGSYIHDSFVELHKVEWPTRSATRRMTIGVIVFCLVIGIFVMLCDWASQWIIQEVIL